MATKPPNVAGVRVLCGGKIAAFRREAGIYWLIGSPRFLPRFTVVSALRCLSFSPQNDAFSPDYAREADEIRILLLRGLNVVGALAVKNNNWEENAKKAIDAVRKLKEFLMYDEADYDIIGAAGDPTSSDIHFFASQPKKASVLETISSIFYDSDAEKYVWENGCLLRCRLQFKLPVYVPTNGATDENVFSSATDTAVRKLLDPQVVYLIEGTEAANQSIVLRGSELDSNKDTSGHEPFVDTVSTSGRNNLSCSHFLSDSNRSSSLSARENADTIQVRIFYSQSGNSCAPSAEYVPATEPVRLIVVDLKMDALCYASKDSTVSSAISGLIIPGLADQLVTLRKCISPKLSSQQPQLCPYHFFPSGILHPVTAIYDLNYGETEKSQVDTRKSLHLRLGLPLDRPLLLISNALDFDNTNVAGSSSGSSGVIKDVHIGIPKSGVSGGLTALVEGSYEYYHYLQDGFDDNGWGCAYRSLQTIISWFRLQNYTSVQVPSHRKIQQALVEVGDKDPYFVGSREWIGAIELSFVLDKLLGVSCKIMNLRSGAELPEKCRELALHFESQGTPVMIGGGVLAYTLLGVDYNEVTGDCAFLILDPHYTGGDDRKKIMNGGWCGWKKAVDSKGKNFFLHDKFYNLLLPQRPNMV